MGIRGSKTSRFVFRLFSSFTTVAAFLSLAVELSYGNRLPLSAAVAKYVMPYVMPLAALVFLFLTNINVQLSTNSSKTKKAVNIFALVGILFKRVSGAGGFMAYNFFDVYTLVLTLAVTK